jgi:hypothetical protein
MYLRMKLCDNFKRWKMKKFYLINILELELKIIVSQIEILNNSLNFSYNIL